MPMLKAGDVMQTGLITVCDDSTVQNVIEKLAQKAITGLPVVDRRNKLLGVVSEKDILTMALRILTGTFDPAEKNRPVKEVMTSDVVTFNPEDDLADVCRCFINHPFRRVLVVQNEKLVGLITRKDMVNNVLANVVS